MRRLVAAGLLTEEDFDRAERMASGWRWLARGGAHPTRRGHARANGLGARRRARDPVRAPVPWDHRTLAHRPLCRRRPPPVRRADASRRR